MDNQTQDITTQNIAESISNATDGTSVQPKQEAYPNLNAGGPAAGTQDNNFAMKWKTEEERRAACKEYCDYLRKGLPKEYYGPAGPETIKTYIKNYPMDFDTEEITRAEREGKQKLIEIGYAGMLGKIPKFQSRTWEFVTQNMTHFKLRQDMTSNDEKIEGVVLYKPEKNTE